MPIGHMCEGYNRLTTLDNTDITYTIRYCIGGVAILDNLLFNQMYVTCIYNVIMYVPCQSEAFFVVMCSL